MLWLAVTQSAVGDQLAKVALAILVFDRTGSPLLTGATYALTYLPYLIAGPLLAPLGDRYRRREVIVVADVIRALLIGAMVVPGVPLWALFALVFAAGLARPPFEAARTAMLPDLLPGDKFVMGSAITQTTHQIAQVMGFAVGGAIVTTIGTKEALAIDAATFALSALLFRIGIRDRPAPGGEHRQKMGRQILRGARVVFGDPRLRSLIGIAMLAGFYVVPEALAVPYVEDQLGLGPTYAGVMLAAGPLGVALGALILSRFFRPSVRVRLMGPLAVGGLLVLIPFWFTPGFAVSCVLVFVSGLALGHNLAANQAFIKIVPNRARGQGLGLAQTMLSLVQGIGTAGGGAVAVALTTPSTISLAGTLGAAVAVLLWLAWMEAVRVHGTEPAPEPPTP